jgi:hypothetical protein
LIRHFVIGRTVDIMVYRTGQTTPSELSKILEIVAMFKTHAMSPLLSDEGQQQFVLDHFF